MTLGWLVERLTSSQRPGVKVLTRQPVMWCHLTVYHKLVEITSGSTWGKLLLYVHFFISLHGTFEQIVRSVCSLWAERVQHSSSTCVCWTAVYFTCYRGIKSTSSHRQLPQLNAVSLVMMIHSHHYRTDNMVSWATVIIQRSCCWIFVSMNWWKML